MLRYCSHIWCIFTYEGISTWSYHQGSLALGTLTYSRLRTSWDGIIIQLAPLSQCTHITWRYNPSISGTESRILTVQPTYPLVIYHENGQCFPFVDVSPFQRKFAGDFPALCLGTPGFIPRQFAIFFSNLRSSLLYSVQCIPGACDPWGLDWVW